MRRGRSGHPTAASFCCTCYPNVLPVATVLLGIDVGEAILRESALSYLGLGIQPPDASWGNMLSNAQSFLTRAPWLVYVPGGVIAATVWCLFTLGDGLRDALDHATCADRAITSRVRRSKRGCPPLVSSLKRPGSSAWCRSCAGNAMRSVSPATV